jgi:dihydroxyacetone kinase
MHCKHQFLQWDTEMGDGDCGDTFARGARGMSHFSFPSAHLFEPSPLLHVHPGVLSALEAGELNSGSLLTSLSVISEIIEDEMGGTSGGILALFVSALTGNLRESASASSSALSVEAWSAAAKSALGALSRYTPAKVGDRTLMDVLIPYVDSLGQTRSVSEATKVAREAAEGTSKLTPKLGRATYVGGGSGSDKKSMPPDPGAYAVYAVLDGLSLGLSG